MKDDPWTILFICQPGELEIKSALLAYSLREQFPDTVKIIAAIPRQDASCIDESILMLFPKINADVLHFTNPFMHNRHDAYPGDWMSNKFYALLSVNDHDDILFLDSDIVCLRPEMPVLPASWSLAAKPADKRTAVNWEKLYETAGLSLPEECVKTTVDQESGPPYYNTGVLYMHKDTRMLLCENWRDYFIFLSDPMRTERLSFDIFHRDQLSFSLAVRKCRIPVTTLNEKFNFPIRHRNTLPPHAVFIHYHDVHTLSGNRELRSRLISAANQFDGLNRRLRKSLLWRLARTKAFRLIYLSRIFVKLGMKIKKTLRFATG